MWELNLTLTVFADGSVIGKNKQNGEYQPKNVQKSKNFATVPK
jgi:hypothetical protein